MPRSALTELASPTHLTATWRDMYSASKKHKRQSHGLDGISIEIFARNSDALIKRISRSLLSGDYAPQQLDPFFIPKPDGSDRLICIPTVTDRLVHRAILRLLHNRGYTFRNSISYGFIKGRSTQAAAQRATQLRNEYPWVYKADISSFFDNISRELLMERVVKNIWLRSLYPIIASIINTEIYCRHQGIKQRVKKLGVIDGIGLRQGMPISPYMANVMLYDFDRFVEDAGIPMVRYADDFVAFGRSFEQCKEIHDQCEKLLEREGLTIHPIDNNGKTTIARPDECIDFLGLGLTKGNSGYQLTVTQKQLQKIKQKILEVSNLDHCLKQGITVSTLIERLEGFTSGYSGSYRLCANQTQLAHTMVAAKAKALHKLFIEQFGIDFQKLTKKQKRFLEINY